MVSLGNLRNELITGTVAGVIALGAFAAASGLGVGVANAEPVLLENHTNELFFQTRENWIDSDADGLISNGDLFYGVINLQNIDASGGPIWSQNITLGARDQLSGYFIQEVSGLSVTGCGALSGTLAGGNCDFDGAGALGPTSGHLTAIFDLIAPAADPNGVFSAADLAAGVVMKIFTDDELNGGPGTLSSTGGPVATDIANSTDGDLWLSLGLIDPDDYWYSTALIDPDLGFGDVLPASVGDTLAGTSIIANNTGHSFARTVNDPSENLVNTDVLLYANAEIVDLTGTQGGGAPWRFQVNDPAALFPIPEPSVLGIFGLGLFALGAVARRRRKAA